MTSIKDGDIYYNIHFRYVLTIKTVNNTAYRGVAHFIDTNKVYGHTDHTSVLIEQIQAKSLVKVTPAIKVLYGI